MSEQFFRDHRIDFLVEGHQHCREGWIQIHCPFCAGGKHGWHLGWNVEGDYFNCWRCGKLSNWKVVEALIKSSDKANIKQALRQLEKPFHIKPPEQRPKVKTVHPPPGTSKMVKPHRNYLKRRRFNPNDLEQQWGLQGTRHLSGKWSWRIIVPIRNEYGNVMLYQGRTILKESEPKYLFTKDRVEDVHRCLYGIDKVQGKSIIVVEGVTDVWRLGAGAVATFGINWQKAQANLIRQFERRFILYDPSPDALKQAEKLGKWLSVFPGETEIIQIESGDPAELTEQEVRQLKSRIGV